MLSNLRTLVGIRPTFPKLERLRPTAAARALIRGRIRFEKQEAGARWMLSDSPTRRPNLIWSLREWMERGAICGLDDLETEAQLSSILYRTTSSGRTEIESKEEGTKRGQASPDHAEAMVLAFWKVVPREQILFQSQPVTISPV